MDSRARRYVASLVRPLLYRGWQRECSLCGGRWRRFLRGGEVVPILRDADVIGAGPREEVHCPSCLSTDRERLVHAYLRSANAFEGQKAVLHVAPEPALGAELRSAHGARYFSADLVDPKAMVRTDLEALAFPDDAFDLVVCNHVLEHVRSDSAAMTEIHRVMKPSGFAVVQVPIAQKLANTIEDPSLTDPDERRTRFGRFDHVRLYVASDYVARLRKAGFHVQTWKFTEEYGIAEAERLGIDPRESLFVASKAS